MRHPMLAGVTLALGMALSACASIGGPGVSSYYDCGGDRMLKVDSLGDDAVQVQVNQDRPIVLRRTQSASGAQYSNAQYTFWDKGGQATWAVGRMVPMQCSRVAVPR